MKANPDCSIRVRLGLSVLLLVCAALRVRLASGGGQRYWPDEVERRGVTEALFTEGLAAAGERLAAPAYHFIYGLAWAVPDALVYATGRNGIPALFFALISVTHVWLLWAICRRAGAPGLEALTAAALLGASVTFFYYARHYLPYDLAMAFGLAAVWAGVGRDPRLWSSLACGALAGLAFVTYAGYWTLAAAAAAIHVTYGRPSPGEAAKRALWCGAGGVAAIALCEGAYLAIAGRSLLDAFTSYAASVDQGTFDEGWRLPFEYLWHAEHLLLILWAGALIATVIRLRSRPLPPLVESSLLALVLIYGAFVLFSVGLERFVLYGRLARQLVPFFCILAAFELVRLRRGRPVAARVVFGAILAAVAVQAAFNFRQPLGQVFPREFISRNDLLVRHVPDGEYRWINAEHIYPAPEEQGVPPGHVVLKESRHPLAFLPYQYEGYTRTERAVLRASDLTMRLVVAEGWEERSTSVRAPSRGD